MTMTEKTRYVQCPRRHLRSKKVVDTNSVLQSLIFFPQCRSYLQGFKIVKSSSISKECKNKETPILTYNFFWLFSTNLEYSCQLNYLHCHYTLFNKHGGWNKRGGGAEVAKSVNVEVGINVEGGILWKKLVNKCNKRGVEGGKNLRSQ